MTRAEAALAARSRSASSTLPRRSVSLDLKVGAVAPTGRSTRCATQGRCSLDNAFSEEDVTRFVERVRRFLKLET